MRNILLLFLNIRIFIIMIGFIIFHFISNSIFLDYISLNTLLFYYVIIVFLDLYFTYKKNKIILRSFFYWLLSFLVIFSVEPYLISLEDNYNNKKYNVLSVAEKTFKNKNYGDNVMINEDCKKIIKNNEFVKVKISKKHFFNYQIFEVEDKKGEFIETKFKLSKQNNKVIYNFSCY